MIRTAVVFVVSVVIQALVSTSAGAEERALGARDLENLLAGGVSPATVEAIVRETGWSVVLSDADLDRLREKGIDEDLVVSLERRRAAPPPLRTDDAVRAIPGPAERAEPLVTVVDASRATPGTGGVVGSYRNAGWPWSLLALLASPFLGAGRIYMSAPGPYVGPGGPYGYYDDYYYPFPTHGAHRGHGFSFHRRHHGHDR